MKPYHYFWGFLSFVLVCIFSDGFIVEFLKTVGASLLIIYFLVPVFLALNSYENTDEMKKILKYFIIYWVLVLPVMYINKTINKLYFYAKERILKVLTRRK